MVTSLKDSTGQTPSGGARPVRREYRNIHITQIASYRLPAAGWASILHRISGAFVFLLLPLAIWLFDKSVTSEVSWEQFTGLFAVGAGFLPGWFFKLLAFGLLWAFFLHFFIGIRHLWMDATHAVELGFGRVSALIAIGLGTLTAFALGVKLFVF